MTAFRAGQHDQGSRGKRLRRLPALHERLEFGAFIIAQYQGRKSLSQHQILRRGLKSPFLMERRGSARM